MLPIRVQGKHSGYKKGAIVGFVTTFLVLFVGSGFDVTFRYIFNPPLVTGLQPIGAILLGTVIGAVINKHVLDS